MKKFLKVKFIYLILKNIYIILHKYRLNLCENSNKFRFYSPVGLDSPMRSMYCVLLAGSCGEGIR